MTTSKAMHTSSRRAAHRINYLDLGSSEEDKDNKDDEHDQNREKAEKALANARSMIGDLERDTSMNADEDDQDETVEEKKQEELSFVLTTTMTQVDFPDAYSISSRASSVIPEVSAMSSEVAG